MHFNGTLVVQGGGGGDLQKYWHCLAWGMKAKLKSSHRIFFSTNYAPIRQRNKKFC